LHYSHIGEGEEWKGGRMEECDNLIIRQWKNGMVEEWKNGTPIAIGWNVEALAKILLRREKSGRME
jgi:hypothetical protein